jgi:hypothetical protein
MQSRTVVLAALLTTVPLLACKALSSGSKEEEQPAASVAASAAEPAAPPASLTGVYRGTFTRKDGKAGRVVGLVTSAGEARFVSDGDVQDVGKLTLVGLDVSGSLDSFIKGKKRETLSVKGKLAPKTSLSGDFTAPSGDGHFDLKFSAEHEKAGSLSALAGTWSNGRGYRMTVDDAGVFDGRDGSPCRYSGKFALADPALDAYGFDLSVSHCGRYDGSYRGHGVIDSGKLAFGVSGDHFALAGTLAKK